MDFKQLFQKYSKKVKHLWKTGKVQKSSRVTYDVVWNVILFFLIISFIGMFFAGGIGAGYFASLVKDEPIRSKEAMKKDIYNYEETTSLYFADKIYLGDVRSDIHREETSLDKISPTLIDAVIATEDEYFEEHKGVVPKAIVRAIMQEALNSDVKTGGSTLTQQLIKNQILTNEVSFERKAKEILLALRLERFFEKDEILEAYLNIVPYGRNASGQNIAGIQTAAQGIFGLNADEVNLAQAAYLAGLPQSPSAYTPFANGGGLKEESGLQPGINRMKSVLNRMYDAEYISEKQYKEAMEYDIKSDFAKGKKSPIEEYPYLTVELQERAKNIIKEYLIEKDGYTLEDVKGNKKLNEEYSILAERSIETDGFHIYSTIDKKIYDVFQKVAKNYEHYGPDRTFTDTNPETGKTVEITEKVQTGAVLRENSTGKIISFVGGRGHKDNQNRHATETLRSPGSTIKPLLDYAPAMEKGYIQPGTVLADYAKKLPGWDYNEPSNYGGGHYGIVSARTALTNSYNMPAAEIYTRMIHENPAKEYLVDKMGISTLTKEEQAYPSLAIGATEKGITVEENVSAFSTFGNNGKFVDGYMIEKITTNDGDVIYQHETKPTDVFSPQTTYLTVDMMRDVINQGTGAYLRSQLSNGGVDWAGKTGTSQDYKDAWFIATNPNVTFGTWIGYDTPHSIYNTGMSLSYSKRNIKLWAQLINSAADIKPELITPSDRFKQPEGIVSRSYCAISGMLPSELCAKAGLVKTDLFNVKYVPTKKDDSLIGGSYVTVNGKAVVAGPNTPSEFVKGDGLAFNPEWLKRNGYDNLSDLSQLYPRTETEKWEKISGPSGGKVGSAIKDDGKSPAAPSSLSKSGSKLTWSKSGSNDVVGYRIYKASAGGDLSLVGSTVDTSYPIGGENAVYRVKAVDYFGKESSPSKELIVGDTDKKEPEKPDKDQDKKKDEKKPDDKKEENKDKKDKEDQDDSKPDEEKQDSEEASENNGGENNTGDKEENANP
ncbi:transglycosylase domain-containing protein [Virgibacillus halodenitrificans]|uniref:transglycosylase domain-containing protein n=1 Tax=Virgibacillus halodenitrificans TaxID=1482 RepID=UPI000EF4B1F2|nr:transglycosylase domain-containing protein [Virgibacillus halodenitrificans]MCJ0931779.1 penicillin-binding protein [Virgibacillus halodenitrificans]